MKIFVHLLAAVLLACGSLYGNPIELDGKLAKPPYKEIPFNSALSSSEVRLLVESGDSAQLYKKAYDILWNMPAIKTEDVTEDELKNRIWLFYYMAASPIYRAEYSPETEYPYWSVPDDDIVAKQCATAFMLHYGFAKILRRFPKIDGKEMTGLIATYYARILSDFRANYDPELRQKVAQLEEEGNRNRYIMIDRKRSRNFESKLTVNKRRNEVLKHYIKYMEKDFVEMLVLYYPGKAHEVFKYIRQAGYEGDAANDLVDRTLGRDGKTEFLYQGANGRRHDKKVRESAEQGKR